MSPGPTSGKRGVEPKPGVMHPVDQAFYELAVKERDFERRSVDRGKALAQALVQACRDTGSPVVPTPVADAIRALGEWAGC